MGMVTAGKELYEAPVSVVRTVAVERGFAASGTVESFAEDDGIEER